MTASRYVLAVSTALPLFAFLLGDLLGTPLGTLPGGLTTRLVNAMSINSGLRPYLDFFTLDSPWLSQLSRLPLFFVASADFANGARIALVFICLSALVSFLFLLPAWSSHFKNGSNSRVSTSTVIFTLAYFTATSLLRFNCGDMQHLFLILALPYFFLRAASSAKRDFHAFYHALCGIFAAIACLLAPLYIPVFLIVEGALLLRSLSSGSTSRFSIEGGKIAPPRAFMYFAAFYLFGLLLQFTVLSADNSLYLKWILPLITSSAGLFDIELHYAAATSQCQWFLYSMLSALAWPLLSGKTDKLTVMLAALTCGGFYLYLSECTGTEATLTLGLFASLLLHGRNLMHFRWSLPSLRFSAFGTVGFILAGAIGVSLFLYGRAAIAQAASTPARNYRDGMPDLGETLRVYSDDASPVLLLSEREEVSQPLLASLGLRQYGYFTSARVFGMYRVLADKGLFGGINNGADIALSPRHWLAEACAHNLAEYYQYCLSRLRLDLQSRKASVLLIQSRPLLDRFRTDMASALAIDSGYDHLLRAAFYNDNRPPREMGGRDNFFDVFVEVGR